MKITLKTAKFQSMVAKAIKGAGNNKLLPITNLICIEKSDGFLKLRTTDTANYVEVITEMPEGDDMCVVVPVDTFGKLISKMTSESITLSVEDDTNLQISGNGKYKLALSVDEDGAIDFPMPEFTGDTFGTVNKTTIKNIIDVNKASVSKKMDTPAFCGYYMHDIIITTDEDTICLNGIKVFDSPLLISPEMIELLTMFSDEKVDVYLSPDTGDLRFETADLVVQGPENDDKDLFPVDALRAYLDETFTSMCKVPKLSLINTMDRLSLFITPYDKNGAYFTFTKRGLDIKSKESSSSEVINYLASENHTAYKCCVDVPQFASQLSAIPGDEVEIWYGHDAAIKLVSGNVTRIISLLEDDSIQSE